MSAEVWVATEAMKEQSAALHHAGMALQACTARFQAIVARAGWGLESAGARGAEYGYGRAFPDLHLAMGVSMPLAPSVELSRIDHGYEAIARIGENASLLARLLILGALEYEEVEGFISAAFASAHEELGHRAGSLIRPVFTDVTGFGAMAFTVGFAFVRWGHHLDDLVSPGWAMFTRLGIDAADELAAGLTGRPADWAAERGPDGLSLIGIAGTVPVVRAALLQLAPALFSHLSSTRAVSIQRGGTQAAIAPRSVKQLAERIPSERADDGATIRIERYRTEEGTSYVVYLSGTSDERILEPSTDAFDMVSNLGLMAGETAASQTAAVMAMREMGIGPDDRVILTGYSQGGLVAMQIAHSGEFSVAGVVTFGSPISHLRSETIPVVEIQHADDVIPALSGMPADHSGTPRTIYSREAFAGESERQDGLAAHAMEEYRGTAGQVDAREDAVILELFAGLSEPVESKATASERPLDGVETSWSSHRSAGLEKAIGQALGDRPSPTVSH